MTHYYKNLISKEKIIVRLDSVLVGNQAQISWLFKSPAKATDSGKLFNITGRQQIAPKIKLYRSKNAALYSVVQLMQSSTTRYFPGLFPTFHPIPDFSLSSPCFLGSPD